MQRSNLPGYATAPACLGPTHIIKSAPFPPSFPSPPLRISNKKTHILHHPHRLLRLRHELILLLLHLPPHLLTNHLQIRIHAPPPPLLPLTRIQTQPRILNPLPCPRRKHQIRIQRRAPPSQEPGLDLRVLRQARLSDFLFREGIFLERGGEGVLGGGGGLRQELGAGEGGARDGVVEGLGLGFGGGGRGEGGLHVGGGGGGGEEVDFLGDGAAEVVEGFADVGRVVVGFVGVLGAVGEESVEIGG